MHVTVRGADHTVPPLLVTEAATAIEFRDAGGKLCALFARNALTAGYWNFVTVGSDDWSQTLLRLGYAQEEQCPSPR